jgi:hypothetical protein
MEQVLKKLIQIILLITIVISSACFLMVFSAIFKFYEIDSKPTPNVTPPAPQDSALTQQVEKEATDFANDQIAQAKAMAFVNSTNALDKTLGKGAYEVLNADIEVVDHEAENVTYFYRVVFYLRFQGPYGYVKREASLACDASGNVMTFLVFPSWAPE